MVLLLYKLKILMYVKVCMCLLNVYLYIKFDIKL